MNLSIIANKYESGTVTALTVLWSAQILEVQYFLCAKTTDEARSVRTGSTTFFVSNFLILDFSK